MYPPQEPGQDMGNMAYMVPPSQFGFANMYMDMNGYSAPAGHYPPYPMAIYAPTMDAMAHQQPHPPQPKKKMTFNKNANFKPNAFNNYIPMNANVPNISPGSSKSSEKGLEYRFEVGNATYFNSEALKESYPIYINTNFAEFSRARSTMEELRKSYSNFKTATVANEPNSVTEETRESEPQREANGEPIPKTEVNSSKEVESISCLLYTSGQTYSLETRVKLIELARKHDMLIVSDDVYDLLRYDDSLDELPHPLPRLTHVDRMSYKHGDSGYGNTCLLYTSRCV